MIRQQIYNPNQILYAADIQATADNGVVEISAIAELSEVGGEVNLVFCKEDYNLYKRIQEGAGAEGVSWEVFSGGGGAFGAAVIANISAKQGTPASKAVQLTTKLQDGTRVNLYTLEGSTELLTRQLSEAEVKEQALEMKREVAEVPSLFVEAPAPYTFTFEVIKTGILIGAVLASGGSGGVSQWASAGTPIYQPQGAPGGAGGLLLSSQENPCVLLPFEGTYTIVVGGTSPANPYYGQVSGQHTTITHDETGFTITAVGGGGGAVAASNSGYVFRAGSGGSAGSPTYGANPSTEASRQQRGSCVPGQGHEAGQTDAYCAPGAGGAGSVGYDGGGMGTAQGGDGVDLFDALQLDANDPQAQLWRRTYTDTDNAGWVAGGGTGRTGTTSSPVAVNLRSKGGGGMSKQSTSDRDAYNHTGSGGGAGNNSMRGGQGANGAVHFVLPA